MNIRLNCDMGEGFGIWKMGKDEELMPHIQLANLACGFHASDANTMSRSIELAKQHDVRIGAHPSYQDLLGFGRRSIPSTFNEIKNMVVYQIGALQGLCQQHSTQVSYVKPHGALYNDMMKDTNIYKAILEAVTIFTPTLKLMILSSPLNETYKTIAQEYGVELLFEAFADRNYTSEGTLVSRTENNAVIHDIEDIIIRIKKLKEFGYIQSIQGKKIYLPVDTLCVHGDNDHAVEFVKALKKEL